jgi:HEAT repeat protein
MLTSLARQNENEKIRESALGALSQSAEPQAIPTVIQFAKEDKSPQVRKQAMRILGRSKDPRAFQFISELLTK